MATTPVGPSTETDQRVRLHGARWEDYERLLAIRGEKATPRITFLEGELELIGPSKRHDGIATMIGRIVEAYAMHREIDLNGFGSWNLKRRKKAGGLEPDECYILGTEDKKRPDLAIEVVLTSGGIDKLEVYRKLEVPEVWTWRAGRIAVHVLRGPRYESAARSELLPELDLDLVARLAERRDQGQAVREFLRTLA